MATLLNGWSVEVNLRKQRGMTQLVSARDYNGIVDLTYQTSVEIEEFNNMNELIAKPVNKALNEYGAVIDLIDRSFPENEKYPFWLIRLWGMIPGNNFLAFYDQGVFVGAMLNFRAKDAVFVLYLVVNDQARSSGYGSGIIQWAKARYGNSCVILNVEAPDENAENNEQRSRRIRFYEKNGFHKTGYQITEGKDNYLVLSTNDFTPKKFYKAIGRMSFGFYAPKLKKSR